MPDARRASTCPPEPAGYWKRLVFLFALYGGYDVVRREASISDRAESSLCYEWHICPGLLTNC
jgi:hypothetical protein